MLTIDLHYVGAFFNPYLLGEAHLHLDADVNKALNKVLWKIVCTLTAYALVLRYFANFVENCLYLDRLCPSFKIFCKFCGKSRSIF
jgi:uncharacterized UPF0160 family protein